MVMGGWPRTSQEPGDRGAAVLEFALVIPVVLVLLFGLIDYGVMLSFRQSVSQSAAEGARAAAVTAAGGSYTTNAANAVSQALPGGVTCSLPAGTLTKSGKNVGSCSATTAGCTYNTSKTCITVTVSYNYAAAPAFPTLPFVPMPTMLSYTAVSEVN